MIKKPYIPTDPPPKNLNWERLASFTTAELTRYDGTLTGVVNPAVLLSPLTLNEAIYPLPKKMVPAKKAEAAYFNPVFSPQ